MTSARVNVSVPSELFARMEAARGDVSRSKFVQRALESALGRVSSGLEPPDQAISSSHPAPSRTSTSSVRSEGVDAMAPSASVAAPAGSSPARSPQPKRVSKKPPSGSIPSIAPRRWAQ